MQLTISGTALLDQMLASDKRFILNVGGSRSGKTYAVLQFILIYALREKGKVITIARKTFPSLRLGAYREFIELLKVSGLYNEAHHNKTNNIYTLNENTIQFISIDQSIKLRGLKHHLVFIDEVNEIGSEEAQQLFMRTEGQIIMAQNPSDALHWSLKLKDHPDCLYLHSTYKDNSFLAPAIVNQIKSYQQTDEDLWNIYGLGLPAKNNELVYSHWQTYEEIDDQAAETIWGLDFGFNHATALVQVKINYDKRTIWCEEIIHQSYLTTNDLITLMRDLNIEGRIYCDSAEPKTIEEIRRAGFEATKSLKEVKAGIDCIKGLHFNIHQSSTKLLEELRRYKWKMASGMKTDEPVRLFDDGLCAIRYAVFTWMTDRGRSNQYQFDIDWIDL